MEIKSPDIEKEESEDDEEDEEEREEVDIDIPKEIYDMEMEKMKRDPQEYICLFMEQNLIYVGRKAFRYISLMPPSLVLSDIPFNSTGIKPAFNLVIVGNPSIGKTTLCNMFCKITLNPIKVKKITNAQLVMRLISEKIFSISLDDFVSLMNDNDGYPKIKTLEGALGDDRMLSSETMKFQTGEVSVRGIGIIGVTPIDLAKYMDYLKSGLFSRMSILWINLTKKQNEDVIKYINLGIGNYKDTTESLVKEKVIRDYYKNLFSIQFNKNTNIKRIAGYKISDDIKNKALNKWNDIIEKFNIKNSGDFKRDLHDFYRYLISSAFLNIYNRKHEDGILVPNEHDCKIALELMSESLQNKVMLSQIESDSKMLRNPKKFIEFMEKHPNMRSDVKKLIAFLSGNTNLLEKYDKIKEIKKEKDGTKNS